MPSFETPSFLIELFEMEIMNTPDFAIIIQRTILGIFFVLPCIESYQKVDLRTITLGVPPQEVSKIHNNFRFRSR